MLNHGQPQRQPPDFARSGRKGGLGGVFHCRSIILGPTDNEMQPRAEKMRRSRLWKNSRAKAGTLSTRIYVASNFPQTRRTTAAFRNVSAGAVGELRASAFSTPLPATGRDGPSTPLPERSHGRCRHADGVLRVPSQPAIWGEGVDTRTRASATEPVIRKRKSRGSRPPAFWNPQLGLACPLSPAAAAGTGGLPTHQDQPPTTQTNWVRGW